MKLMTVLFPLLVLIFGFLAHAQESFEDRMHDIYRSSYSSEIREEQWIEFLRGIDDRTYEVVLGDTLWGLSLVFFGDGNYWPKIWSYNQTLTNPHLLTLGQKIIVVHSHASHWCKCAHSKALAQLFQRTVPRFVHFFQILVKI